jgi:hypothetical protein
VTKKKLPKKTIFTPKDVLEVRRRLDTCKTQFDPDHILERFMDELTDKVNVELTEEENDLLVKAVSIEGLNNHILLSNVTYDQERPFIIQFAKDLIGEYDCTSPSEKSLAQVVACSYIRVMDLSRIMSKELGNNRISDLRNTYIKNLGKELDRANRTYITALQTLKQLKSPQISVKVTATNAFISENQQINSNIDEKDKQ